MMMSDYRGFGECQKVILNAGESFSIGTATAASQLVKGIVPKVPYKHALVLSLADSVLAGVTIAFDPSADTYAISLAGQAQVIGVTAMSLTSGQVEVFLFI